MEISSFSGLCWPELVEELSLGKVIKKSDMLSALAILPLVLKLLTNTKPATNIIAKTTM